MSILRGSKVIRWIWNIHSTYKIYREPVHRTANRMEDKAIANCREVIREIHFSSETLQRSPKRVKFCDELFPYPIVQMYSMFPRLGAVYHYLICQVMEFLPAIPSHHLYVFPGRCKGNRKAKS